MKRKKTKKSKKRSVDYVTACPRCLSRDISRKRSYLHEAYALPLPYECNKCGFIGFLFPEVPKSKSKK